MENERASLVKQAEAQREEIATLRINVDKAIRGGDDRIHDAENRYHESEQQMQTEHAHELARAAEDLEAKSAQIEEYSNYIQKLEIEISEHKKLASQLADELEAKREENQKIAAKLDEANAGWNARIEETASSVQDQYETLLNSVKQKNQELRTLCSKTNQSMLDTERHNRELIRRIGALERSIEQTTQQLATTKEQLARDKQLFETKAKADEMRTEMKCHAEIEKLKSSFDDELRRLFAIVGRQFPHLLDVRDTLDERAFKSVVEKAGAEIVKLRDNDAALRRLLCLSPNESTEDAVSKLLLSLYRQ
jgi:chromosome segregation ATPase